MADLLFSYECQASDCGMTFDLRGEREDVTRCIACGKRATHVYTTGSWTRHGAGILAEHYDETIGAVVSGYRGMEKQARAAGLNPLETSLYTRRSTPRRSPSEGEVEKAYFELKAEDVLRHEEQRLRSSYETRNGIHDHTQPEKSRFSDGGKIDLTPVDEKQSLK